MQEIRRQGEHALNAGSVQCSFSSIWGGLQPLSSPNPKFLMISRWSEKLQEHVHIYIYNICTCIYIYRYCSPLGIFHNAYDLLWRSIASLKLARIIFEVSRPRFVFIKIEGYFAISTVPSRFRIQPAKYFAANHLSMIWFQKEHTYYIYVYVSWIESFAPVPGGPHAYSMSGNFPHPSVSPGGSLLLACTVAELCEP